MAFLSYLEGSGPKPQEDPPNSMVEAVIQIIKE
jgi:hypothetical protein